MGFGWSQALFRKFKNFCMWCSANAALDAPFPACPTHEVSHVVSPCLWQHPRQGVGALTTRHANTSGESPPLCHPERRENVAARHSNAVELLRVENAPFGASQQAKAQVLAYASRSGISERFAQCLLSQSNILYLPQPLAYRTAEDVGPYKGIINRLPDPQSAILAL